MTLRPVAAVLGAALATGACYRPLLGPDVDDAGGDSSGGDDTSGDGDTSSSGDAPTEPPPPTCHASYTPCLPLVDDLNCPDVVALGLAPVTVVGPDEYGLDADGDGIGCED